jgi:hypothetical protein
MRYSGRDKDTDLFVFQAVRSKIVLHSQRMLFPNPWTPDIPCCSYEYSLTNASSYNQKRVRKG